MEDLVSKRMVSCPAFYPLVRLQTVGTLPCDTIQRFLNWSTRHARSSRVDFYRSKPSNHDAAYSRMSEVSLHQKARWFPRTLHLRLLCSVPLCVKSAWSRTATVIRTFEHSRLRNGLRRMYFDVCPIHGLLFWHFQFLLSIRLCNPRVKSDIYRILELSLLVTQ